MNSNLKKLIIIAGICGILGIGYGVDSIIAKSYSLEFTNIAQITENPILDINGNVIPSDCGVTDGQTKMEFTVKLTRNGSSVSGHTLYVKTNRNVIGRFITDENGMISFQYRCYKARTADKVKDVTVTVKDESNSVLIVVPVVNDYTLKMYQGEETGSGMMTDDVFFE